jgi:hypothetical protein|tara:strand:- start:573 stop:710 length:138 start_codon:yes stop_codon:yes gene_type:complete
VEFFYPIEEYKSEDSSLGRYDYLIRGNNLYSAYDPFLKEWEDPLS